MAFLFIIIIVAAAHTHFCCIPVTTESDTAPAKVQPCAIRGVLYFFLVFPHLGEGPTVAYINSHPSLSPRVSSFNALVC